MPSDAEVMLQAITDRGAVKLDREGAIVRWSAGAQALFGYSEAEALGRPVSMLHTDEDRAAGFAERELAAAQTSDCVEFEGWRVRKGGQYFRAAVTISAIRDRAGSLAGFVEVIQDLLTDQQRAHPGFYDLLESAPDALLIVGPDGRITLSNHQAGRMFGYPREELAGKEVEILLPPRLRGGHRHRRAEFVGNPSERQMGAGLELWGLRSDGTEFPVDISLSPLHIDHTVYVSAAIRDITDRYESAQQLRRQHEELLAAQRKLERFARIDALTGLANHGETIARLEAALQDRRLPGSHLGVLFCDVDHFKSVNDTYGHDVGDSVLSAIAARLRTCVREGDTVGRIGGDEMLVLLPGVHSIDEVVSLAEKIRTRIAEPIQVGQIVHATLSIGATLAIPGESVSVMTARADAAMYKSKKAGRNTVTSI